MPKAQPETNYEPAQRDNHRDNRFITIHAHREGDCEECGTPINRGDRIRWDRLWKKAYCEKCGEDLEN